MAKALSIELPERACAAVSEGFCHSWRHSGAAGGRGGEAAAGSEQGPKSPRSRRGALCPPLVKPRHDGATLTAKMRYRQEGRSPCT